MATNVYFSQRVKSEQNLYEDIIIESLKMYGQDIYYLPRDVISEDRILGEDIPSRFNSAYKIEMYIENTDGFDGEGDLFTKFGIEIRDQANFIVSRKRWKNTVSRYDNEIQSDRPREGDIIYLPLSNSMFQIMSVEHESPFYQISNLPTYKMRCELFEYSNEDFDTNVAAIDDIERDYAYEYLLTLDSASYGFVIGETVNQLLGESGDLMSGEVSRWSDSDNVLGVIHAGGNSGVYREFTPGAIISGTTPQGSLIGTISQANVNLVEEVNKLSENEQNLDFETTQDDLGFLDFSESNPFGDPQ